MSNEFVKHLEWASIVVASWPKWKQNILGATVMGDVYEDSNEREEKDLRLHIAKMIEHMEFENTLPELEKNKRRLIRSIQGLHNAAETAAKTDTPWLLFGQLERMCFYAEQILGDDWREQAQAQRKAFLYGDDEEGEFDDDASFDEL